MLFGTFNAAEFSFVAFLKSVLSCNLALSSAGASFDLLAPCDALYTLRLTPIKLWNPLKAGCNSLNDKELCPFLHCWQRPRTHFCFQEATLVHKALVLSLITGVPAVRPEPRRPSSTAKFFPFCAFKQVTQQFFLHSHHTVGVASKFFSFPKGSEYMNKAEHLHS